MKDQTEILVIVDASGSMHPRYEDTIGGFDKFMDEQKLVKTPCFVTLVQFSDSAKVLYSRKPLEEVDTLRNHYHISGMTALHDAIGKGTDTLGAALRNLPEEERPSKVVVLVLTDGGENSSKEYTHTRVREMIKHQQEVYNWTYVFMGADIDAYTVGKHLGIQQGNIVSGHGSNMLGLYASAASAMTRSRTVGSSSLGYFSAEEKQVAEAHTDEQIKKLLQTTQGDENG